MAWFIKLVLAVSPAGDIARQIANAHTAFNVINTLIFIPFTGPFIKLVERLLPDKSEVISRRPVYLDEAMLKTPSIAMSLAVKEVVRMGNLASKNVRLAMEAINEYDDNKVNYVLDHEPVVDNLETEITHYLTEMSEVPMGNDLSERHTGLLHACNDIERIGDHGKTLAKRARKLFEDEIAFSPEAKEELLVLSEMVNKASTRSLEALEKNDKVIAAEAIELCREVKRFQKEIRKNHITRLNERRCDPVAGFMMLELLINMKRVADHSKNISQLVQGTF
jgi:phosphate:Na+ symporter